MAKRKQSYKNKKPDEFKSKTSGRSFWTNAGQSPMPAVNTDRPFDFDVGFPNNPSVGFAPYMSGSAEYVTTTFSVPDNWCDCAAFDLSIQRLYQSIRENLKSNLSYDVLDLKAYIASVTWLQAICSCINRDFAFLKFRDPQHPTFEHIWGKYGAAPERNNYIMTKLTKGVALDKAYLTNMDMATSLTYIDNVVIPKLNLLAIPPAAAEFSRWLFDCIYIDAINPSRAQWYWNEIERIPMYRYSKVDPADTSPTFHVAGYMSTYTMTLEDLVDYATDIAATYGVILADLRRCGASMVTPSIQTMSERQPLMKYDDNFFYALRNAYTSKWDSDLNGLSPEFFLVDFYEGMTSEQMCTALCLAGAISDNSELVKPLVTKYQSVIVEIDHTQKLFIDPLQYYPGSGGTTKFVSDDTPGIYYMSWETCATSTNVIESSGTYGQVDTITSSYTDYGFNSGVTRYSNTYDVDPAVIMSGTLAIGIGTGYTTNTYNVSDLVGIYFNVPATSFTLIVDKPSAKVYQATTGANTIRYGNNNTLLLSGVTTFTITKTFTKQAGFFRSKWECITEISNQTSTTDYSGAANLYHLRFTGSLFIGHQSGSSIQVQCDPSVSAFDWIVQEVDHHIPLRVTNYGYDKSSSTVLYEQRSLLKETNVTTLYTKEELSSLLYSLNLSLFTVHANSRQFKQA